MLGKLLKQDFRATARIMLPLYVAVPVLGLFTNLITRLCENQNGFLIRAISALVSFVFSLSLIAAVVTTITQAQAGWLTVGVVVLVVLCGLALCLMTYAAMAIGQSFKKNKGLMSVVFFFVLWIGTRIVLTLIFGAFYWPATSAVNTMTVLQALWTVLGCACVGALAFCVGFFFLTHGMLRKHLNLQ